MNRRLRAAPRIPEGVEPDLVVFGMKRSGHHAVMLSAISHLPEVVHLNDYHTVKRDHGMSFSLIQHGRVAVRDYSPTGNEKHWCVNVEDSVSIYVDFIELAGRWPGSERLMVIRDPYNQSASRARRGWPLLLERWKAFARFADGEHLSFAKVIKFNEWVKDVGHHSISPYGGGSSFSPDSLSYSDRWEYLIGDPLAKPLVETAGILDYASTLFGHNEMHNIHDTLSQAQETHA